jgi:hypothetical protein
MTDPLNDPRFPDRPQHQDFWSLVDVVNQLDGQTSEGQQSLEQVLDQLIHVDTESLTYMASQRALKAIEVLHLNPAMEQAFTAVFINAFAAGVLFERKRPAPH